MKLYKYLIPWIVLVASLASGQSTTVTATITDSNAQVWANGAYQVSFVNPRGGPAQWTGGPFTHNYPPAPLDGSGAFTIVLPDNNFITPIGTMWQFTICPNATAPCGQVSVAVTGAGIDLSTTLSAVAKPPAVNPSQVMNKAYVDSEVNLPPYAPNAQSTLYYDVTLNCIKFFDGSAWACTGTGTGTIGGSGTLNFLPIWVDTTTLGNSIIEQQTNNLVIHGVGPFGVESTYGTTDTVSDSGQTEAYFAPSGFLQQSVNGAAYVPYAVGPGTSLANHVALFGGTDGFTLIDGGALPGGTTPGGADTNVQYNDSSTFGGDGNFTWNKTNHTLLITGSGSNIALDINGHAAFRNAIGLGASPDYGTAGYHLRSNGGGAADSWENPQVTVNTTSPLGGGGSLNPGGSITLTCGTCTSLSGLTTNKLQKALSATTIGDSNAYDDGTHAVAINNGVDFGTAGGANIVRVNDTITGTSANKFVCKSATAGSVVICPTSTTTGVLGVAIAGVTSAGVATAPGTSGSTSICNNENCSVVMDNNSTIGHYCIPSVTNAGECHDTGGTTPNPTTDNFLVLTAVLGGNSAVVEINTPDWFSSNNQAKVYQLKVNGGTTLTPGDTVNFNGTTPAAGSNGKNVTIQTSKSGTTDSISAELVGDGTATHFLDGTGNYSTPVGTGSVTYNGQTVAIGGNGNVNSGAATHSISLNEGNGSAITGLALGAHQVAVGIASADPTAKTIPDCTDTTGNHLNYTQSSDSWSCGTTDSHVGTTVTIASGAKALATSSITSGTCTSAQTDTATGTLTTDAINASFNADPTGVTGYSPSTNGMLAIIMYPTADTVNFKICNNTSADITPGAITLNWRVTR